MVENWITAEMIQNNMRRNGIILSKEDAGSILSRLDQQSAYASHDGRVTAKIWTGETINGVDVSKGRIRRRETIVEINGKKVKAIEEYIDPSDKFIVDGTGHAYIIMVDGNIVVYQPHVPGINGFHALTHPTMKHPVSHKPVTKCVCGQTHDINDIMEKARQDVVRNMASGELNTKILYMAQEIWETKQAKLNKLLDHL